jgi:23S rRNA maturation-related 3'-5' exoribonuclease YhaM
MSNIPTDIEDRKAIRQAFDQISEELASIKTSKDQIKEILKSLEDKYKLNKRTAKKAANLYHKQTVMEFENETAEVREVYKAISEVYKSRIS